MNLTKNPNLKIFFLFFLFLGGGDREREGGEEGDSKPEKNTKNNRYSLIFCAHALYKI